MARTTIIAARAFLAVAFLLSIEAAHGADGPQWPDLSPQGRARAVAAGEARWPLVAPPPPVSVFTGEMGLRYWYSWGKAAKDLYNVAGTGLVSRLTYDELRGHSGELFGRVDHSSGFFVKGYAGIGTLASGKLNDEDFPPVVSPYSNTLSQQEGGHLGYFSIDGGFNVLRNRDLRLGAFAGYHYFEEKLTAYGCHQVASNAAFCGGSGIPDHILGITQHNHWHSVRVGGEMEVRLFDRLKLSVDAAYLPYVKLDGADFHWLRIGTAPGDFIGSIPEDGRGRGYQLQAALSYAVNQNVSFAVGGRYWRMESNGHTHFENNVVGATSFPQPVDWKTEHMGVFVQGSFKFGPYAAGSRF